MDKDGIENGRGNNLENWGMADCFKLCDDKKWRIKALGSDQTLTGCAYYYKSASGEGTHEHGTCITYTGSVTQGSGTKGDGIDHSCYHRGKKQIIVK